MYLCFFVIVFKSFKEVVVKTLSLYELNKIPSFNFNFNLDKPRNSNSYCRETVCENVCVCMPYLCEQIFVCVRDHISRAAINIINAHEIFEHLQ